MKNLYKKVVCYERNGQRVHGLVDGDAVKGLRDWDLADWPEHGDAALRETGETFALSELNLIAPVSPGKIIAIGLNYRDHIQEMGHAKPEEPVMFLKAPSAVAAPRQAIELPANGGRVDYEGELAVVIGKTCKNVAEGDAASVIAGYACANDVTSRTLQKKDGQWSRAKGFDTFCPLGPALLLNQPGVDPDNLPIRTYLNGKPVQQSNTAQMVFSVHRLVAFVSSVMTLHPGDVILTGTPSGVGPLQPGDEVTVEIEPIGRLTNPVE